MEIILRIFQVFLAIGLIGVVLLQRSEGGGLGIGSSGGAGSFMSVRGSANFLTRVTSIFGGLFMVTCLAMAILAKPSQTQRSIFDTPAPIPAGAAGQAPAIPAPTVPESAPAIPQPAESNAAPSPAAPASPAAEAPQAPAPTAEPAPAPATKPSASAPKKPRQSGATPPRSQ